MPSERLRGEAAIQKLRELKEGLDSFEREHAEILAQEPTIAHPVHDAAAEARRRYNGINEGRKP